MVFTRIKKEIVRALNEEGITLPTGIQTKAIPPILEGKDVIGTSKTGSGKTAAFAIPMLERLSPERVIQYLVICPTRELAVQIANEVKKFGKYLPVHVATVYGGASINVQIDELKRANIVIGTPGRLLDHLGRRTINLRHIRCLVLDEADKMVEMGFIEDVTKIVSQMPHNRQILLFGATISEEIDGLKKKYMNNPEIVRDREHVEEDMLEQYYYDIPYPEKFSLLVHLLNKPEMTKVIIFCSARSTVEFVAKNLRKQKFELEMIHGKLSQSRRLRVIDDFNKNRLHILVASSVAARGLDIKEISHVVNYDLSKDPQEYVHRVGRTARAGEKGKAITLLSARDHDVFRTILMRYPVNVQLLPREKFPRIQFMARDQRPQHFSRSPGRFPSRGQGYGRRR